ncbi:MAG: hypothetical protein E7491_00370 [Ruminococcaceae bacterium]|nr:hypothetical protein [Oscillospiraceae bacterium]
MKKYTVLLTLIAIFVLFCACGNSAADDATPTPTAIATPTQTSTPTATSTITPVFTYIKPTYPTTTPTCTPTPVAYHQTYEALVFDGEYNHENLIEFVVNLAIASNNHIFLCPGGLDGYQEFKENNLFKLFLYRKGHLYEKNKNGKYVFPVDDVIDFLVDAHFSNPVTVNEKEFSNRKTPKRYVFDPLLVDFAEFDAKKNALILDEIPDIRFVPFFNDVTIRVDPKNDKAGSITIIGTALLGDGIVPFNESVRAQCIYNKENKDEIIRVVFRGCGGMHA